MHFIRGFFIVDKSVTKEMPFAGWILKIIL